VSDNGSRQLRVTLVTRGGKRRVTNSDALVALMKSLGAVVTSIDPGPPNWPLDRLGPLLAETDVFVLTNGAAMANAVLLRPGAVMLVLWVANFLPTNGFYGVEMRLSAEVDAFCRAVCVHYMQVWSPPRPERVRELVWALPASSYAFDVYLRDLDFLVNETEFLARFADAARQSASGPCQANEAMRS
jgi:Glycosyltransferase 61